MVTDDVIEVGGGFVLETLADAHQDFTRGAANSRRDGHDHHCVEKADDLLSREHQDRPSLVGRAEFVRPNLAAAYVSGHAPSPSQPSNPSPRPPGFAYARR